MAQILRGQEQGRYRLPAVLVCNKNSRLFAKPGGADYLGSMGIAGARKKNGGVGRVAKHTRRVRSPPNTPISFLLSRQFPKNHYLSAYVTLTVTEIWVCPGWIGTEAFGAAEAPPPPIP